MPARRILQLGDPVLRQVSGPVRDPGDVRLTLRDLCATLREFRRTHGFGRGISAVQIGELSRVIYIEFGQTAYSLINPTFEFRSPEQFRLWDDCFSFPDLMVLVDRSARVALRYQDESGTFQSLEAEGALSELIQHEMDHLDGVLAVDRAVNRNAFCTRAEWERRFGGGLRGGRAASVPRSECLDTA